MSKYKPACPGIYEMCKEHFNEPVLTVFELGRVIGYADDMEDCYLIIKYPGGKVVRHTAVGGYTFLNRLKGQNEVIPTNPSFEGEVWDDLSRLDSMLECNEVPKEKEFIVDCRPLETYHSPEYFKKVADMEGKTVQELFDEVEQSRLEQHATKDN